MLHAVEHLNQVETVPQTWVIISWGLVPSAEVDSGFNCRLGEMGCRLECRVALSIYTPNSARSETMSAIKKADIYPNRLV